jgi:hypothetical protein
MKVKDLIKLLGEHNPEAEVGFSHPSHDYWKTRLVGVIDEAEEAEVTMSEYHRAWRLADDHEEGTTTMVVLNGS